VQHKNLPTSSALLFHEVALGRGLELPLYSEAVSAGFPSPAQDYQEGKIDLNRELIQRPDATFCVTVSGESMIDANLQDGDMLLVERGLDAHSGDIILAILDGDFTVKRLHRDGNSIALLPANSRFAPIPIHADQDFAVWGVVKWVLHKVTRRA
jgi:DNA polymerase V